MLKRLKESTFDSFVKISEAQHGPVRYSSNHQPGMRVPVGGSMCANCKYLGKDKKTCVNKDFIVWNRSNRLPDLADRYCSDWYEPKEGQNGNPKR